MSTSENSEIQGEKPIFDLKEMRKAFNKEMQATEKDAPKLAGFSEKKIRINESQVIRSTPRVITQIRRLMKDYPDNTTDPIFIIEKLIRPLSDNDKAKLSKDLSMLITGTYKVNGRKVHSVNFSDISIKYEPIDSESVMFNAYKLTPNWAIKGPANFITSLTIEIDARKNMKKGFALSDKTRILEFLEKIEKTDEEKENKVKAVVAAMLNALSLKIPKDYEVVPIPRVESELEESIRLQNFIDLSRLYKAPGLDAFPDVYKRVEDKLKELEATINRDSILTETKRLLVFENFDYMPPSLEYKLDSYKIWGDAIRLENSRKMKYMKVDNVVNVMKGKREKREFEQHGKVFNRGDMPELTVWNIDENKVPDSLRKSVRQHLGDWPSIEDFVYNPDLTIREYVFKIAYISSLFAEPFDIRRNLSSIVSEDDQNLPSRKLLLPAFYTNAELVSNKREFGKLERYFDDIQNVEANLILHDWQPAVKKDWFPVSTAPNNFNPSKWILGKECAKDRIYVLNEAGEIQCLDKEYVKANIEKYKKYNRVDLENVI